MTKEFVPYELAVKLEELGFDEQWFGYYLCKNSAFGVRLEITTNWIDLLPYDSSSCKAPTFSQAFRWFREKHEVVGIVKFGTNEFTFNIYNSDGIGLLTKESLAFNGTYEEAERACLEKLIEIVEQIKN
jgi:hypothetical protein